MYANYLQTPSRRASSRRPFPQSRSSTSSTRPSPHRTRTTMLPPTSRSASSSTTSSVRTSRRSSFPARSTGSPARLCSTRTSRTSTRASSRMKTMRTRTSLATTVTRTRSQMTRYEISPLSQTHKPRANRSRMTAQNPSRRLLSASRARFLKLRTRFPCLRDVGHVLPIYQNAFQWL